MTNYLNRESSYPVLPLLLSRVSSRAFSQERLSEEELMSLFEAARWAPSSYNGQPWRFIYGRRGEKEWDSFFDLLVDFNKSWCKDADTLVLITTRTLFERNEKPAPTAQLDAGAAWMSLAIEAHSRNIVAHGMAGFDYEGARKTFQIPEVYSVLAMVAIGKQGNPEALPEDLKKQEVPSTRKPLDSILSKGSFPFK